MTSRADELRHIRRQLKSGEYDGTVIMAAWTALEAYAADLDRRAEGVTDEIAYQIARAVLPFHEVHHSDVVRVESALQAIWPVAAEPEQPADSGRVNEVTLREAAEEALTLLDDLDPRHGITTQLRAAIAAQGQSASPAGVPDEVRAKAARIVAQFDAASAAPDVALMNYGACAIDVLRALAAAPPSQESQPNG